MFGWLGFGDRFAYQVMHIVDKHALGKSCRVAE